jgi:hypothetical protein
MYDLDRAPVQVRAQHDRDVDAERRLIRSVLLWVGILVPIGAAVFALLIYIATDLASAPEGGPILMGAATGVLAGLFFGVWAGVVVSSGQIERTERGD